MAENRKTATSSKETFERLARAQLPRLYALARRLTDRGPEDLVQECLLRAYRSYHTLADPEAGARGSRRSWSMPSATAFARSHDR